MSHSSHRTAWLGAAAVCLASCFGSAGCVVAEMAEEAWFQTTRTLDPNTKDYVDPTENLTQDWSEAGEIGRADQERIQDDPAWYQDWFMSPKARDIERNLGFD
ncbi:MAG: hypothetical protein AAF907_07905 [Planctomycetota bacterium]